MDNSYAQTMIEVLLKINHNLQETQHTLKEIKKIYEGIQNGNKQKQSSFFKS